MVDEEIIEEGIVVKSENGIAEIQLKETDECEECTAKLFCKTGEEKTKLISAVDPFGTAIGDVVKISVKGRSILKATFQLYGIPLVILVFSIIVGMFLFSETTQPELYSFLSSLAGLGIYYSLFFLNSKRKSTPSQFAKIVNVNKK